MPKPLALAATLVGAVLMVAGLALVAIPVAFLAAGAALAAAGLTANVERPRPRRPGRG
jgi:hypothetical protein